MAGSLRPLKADVFARRLAAAGRDQDKRYAFFLGAGCSISSGIPAAGTLVSSHWLPRLCELHAPNRQDVAAWVVETYPAYDPDSPAAFYGTAAEELFLLPEERQHEIERLCDSKFPGFGYATLASLMATEGGRFNIALTTNFDDLLADALYLFTPARPLVIPHESLASYIRPTRTRPLVVKLHGDNRLSPMNTAQETSRLKEEIEDQVRSLLHDRGIIFLGYGGNDESIARMLQGLPPNALPLGIFWINSREPTGVLRQWLESRNAFWIEKADFDEFMLLVRDAFNLAHPERRRFDEVFEKYKATYDTLSGRIVSLPDSVPEAPALKRAVESADQSFSDWWSVETAASRVKDMDPNQAEAIYAEGIKQFPGSASLLGNYAVFLETARRDYDRAEDLYRRALDADARHANNVGNYASFLRDVRKDYDRAEDLYRRALDLDPRHVNNLSNYAVFLRDVRKDYDRAEEHFRRALDADPNHANNLANFAGFLLAERPGQDGLAYLARALHVLTDLDMPATLAECWFYALAHRPAELRGEALTKLKQALLTGARSPGWDLSGNVERARQDGHPDADWLEKLAAVIADGADVTILDAWPAWQAA